MKKIALVLIVSVIIVLTLFHLLKIPFDNNFIANLLNGILSNLLILIGAIFIIDNLNKKIQVSNLKKINKRKSEFVSFRINIFLFKLLEYLDVLDKSHIKQRMDQNTDLTFNYVWLELEKIKHKNIDQLLIDKTLEKEDKNKYLTDLIELIKENGNGISEALKDIYPHPAPEVVSTLDDIYAQSGAISAMSVVASARSELIKKDPNLGKQFDIKTSEALLNFFMIFLKDRGCLKIICDKLTTVSSAAKNNNLFISY